MKRLIFPTILLLFTISCNKGPEDYLIRITDDSFRSWCVTNLDKDSDGILSKDEILATTDIDCTFKDIASMDGIELFTNLRNLFCYGNSISSLNLSSNKKIESLYAQNCGLDDINLNGLSNLRYLNIGGNNLESIDLSSLKDLRILHISDNPLRKLDVSNNTQLAEVECMRCKYDSLDFSMCNHIVYLRCRENNLLRYLDVSGCSKMLELSCNVCIIKTLKLDGCDSLILLYCNENALRSLDVSGMKNLTTLWAYSNRLESLDASNCVKLEHCHAYQNQLKTINLSGCTSIAYMNISSNQLTKLDLSSCANSLVELYCQDNKIEKLDIAYNKNLEKVFAFNNQFTGNLVLSFEPKLEVLHLYDNPRLTGIQVNGADRLVQMNANNCGLNNVSLKYAARAMELFWCQQNPDLKSITLCEGQTIDDLKTDANVKVVYE